MAETARILIYGLVAAASPTVLLATLVVLGSGRGRLNGVVFLAAFVVGQSLAYLVVFVLGSTFSTGDDTPSRVVSVLELLAGIALIAVAQRQRASDRGQRAGRPPRTQALFARLSNVRPAVSFGIGMPLGVGVKRLVLSILAATTVATAGLDGRDELALSVLYVAIATLVVSIPVVVYLILGERADGLMADAKGWITANEERLAVISAFVLGAFLVVDALVTLLL